MDLGTAPLFDLTAPRADEADERAGSAGSAAAQPVESSRADALLVGIRDNRAVLLDCQVNEVRRIAEWAAEHTVADEADASTITDRGLDTGLPVAGPGAPLISDFAVMELAAVLGRSLDSGRSYVGQVVELAYRLPRTWARVLAGRVPVWKALRIAESTRLLPEDAVAYVDRQLAPVAHGCTWAQVDRLIETALVRFDPAAAEERRQAAQESRHADIDTTHVGFDGTAHISATVDIADALDLEAAVARRAKLLGQLGCEESLDVRRSVALGEIAREDLSLALEVIDPDTGEITRTIPGRKTELVLHLGPDVGISPGGPDGAVGRLGNTRTPISVELVKEWLGTPDTTVIVRPVIDLNGHQPVDSYEIPDRIRREVLLRDPHCTFPYCHRPAEACDLDHVVPHGEGGPTCKCNLIPECRGHHRFKTHGQITCRILSPGTYLWTAENGHQWLVDPTGTYDLTALAALPACPADPPEE